MVSGREMRIQVIVMLEAVWVHPETAGALRPDLLGCDVGGGEESGTATATARRVTVLLLGMGWRSCSGSGVRLGETESREGDMVDRRADLRGEGLEGDDSGAGNSRGW